MNPQASRHSSRTWPSLQIEYLDRLDCLGYLLPVSTHILHRSAADATRNAAQALDPCAISTDGVRNEVVPGFSGADIEQNSPFDLAGTLFYAPDRDLQHQARPT